MPSSTGPGGENIVWYFYNNLWQSVLSPFEVWSYVIVFDSTKDNIVSKFYFFVFHM